MDEAQATGAPSESELEAILNAAALLHDQFKKLKAVFVAQMEQDVKLDKQLAEMRSKWKGENDNSAVIANQCVTLNIQDRRPSRGAGNLRTSHVAKKGRRKLKWSRYRVLVDFLFVCLAHINGAHVFAQK